MFPKSPFSDAGGSGGGSAAGAFGCGRTARRNLHHKWPAPRRYMQICIDGMAIPASRAKIAKKLIDTPFTNACIVIDASREFEGT